MALFKKKTTGEVITAFGPVEKHYASLPQKWERLEAKPTKPANQNDPKGN